MAAAAVSAPDPTATSPQSPAPPNFYSQAGHFAAGAGGQGSPLVPGQQPPAQAQPDNDADRMFLQSTMKLLDVLAKMQTMKPHGVDVSRYIKSAATSVKEAMKAAGAGQNGEQSEGGSASDATGDVGDAAGAASGPVAGAGVGGAGGADTGATGATS